MSSWRRTAAPGDTDVASFPFLERCPAIQVVASSMADKSEVPIHLSRLFPPSTISKFLTAITRGEGNCHIRMSPLEEKNDA